MRAQTTDVTAERSLDTQQRASLICLAYFYLYMLSMDVCTTSCCQAFGRLVHGLNVFTVQALVLHTMYGLRWFIGLVWE